MAPAFGRPIAGTSRSCLVATTSTLISRRARRHPVKCALDDDNLDSFVETLVRRLASFDRETLAAAKAQVNRFGTPTVTELQSSNDTVLPTAGLARCTQARRAKVRNIGYGVRSDFELNFGRYLPSFGRTEDDDRDTQPG